MKKTIILAALLALALTLSACAPKPAPAAPTQLATLAPEATAEPTDAPADAPQEEQDQEQEQADEPAEVAGEAVYRRITAAEAKARMDSGDELIILDVRTPGEYAEGHIAGAVLLPVDSINEDVTELLSDKNAEILVYCRSGNRSQVAANLLVGLGYTRVYDFGGINSWTYGLVTD